MFKAVFGFGQEFKTDDIPNLTGKVAIVTGGNTGLGYGTVVQLALKGTVPLIIDGKRLSRFYSDSI